MLIQVTWKPTRSRRDKPLGFRDLGESWARVANDAVIMVLTAALSDPLEFKCLKENMSEHVRNTTINQSINQYIVESKTVVTQIITV